MRLDVLECRAMPASKFPDGTHLVDDIVDEFAGRSVDLAAAETLQIVIAGMGADRDAMLDGELDRLVIRLGSPA
jgi:hypothetical protein